jgi:hypothetical protein
MNDIEHKLKLLERAKLLTGSSDIAVLIAAAEQIEQWAVPTPAPPPPSQNVVEFVERCVINHPTRGAIPINLQQYQKDFLQFLDNETRVKVVNHARQMGITYMTAMFALYRAARYPNEVIVICSSTLRGAFEIIERVRYAIINSQQLFPSIVETNKGNLLFANGSRIIARATTEFALRDIVPTQLLIDNAEDVSYTTFEKFWWSVQPLLPMNVVVMSTPKSPHGVFYRMVTDHAKMNMGYMRIPWSSHPDRDQAWADLQKSYLGEETFRMQHECQFGVGL